MSSQLLNETYTKEILPQLREEFKIANVMAVPKLEKVVINTGVGQALADKSQIDKAAEDLALITGQKPKVNPAKKAVASFKLRKGNPIGLKVSLRGKRMYDFVDKLFRVVLPQLRDFRGLQLNSFDGRGNYNLGLKEQIVFPEIEYGKIDRIRGLEITFVTSTSDDIQAKRLLELLGCPFAKES